MPKEKLQKVLAGEIFKCGELNENSVTEKNSATAADGKNYMTKFYNLDAIISVGYRLNSIRATQFRQWCTYVIRQFSLRGYIIDNLRMDYIDKSNLIGNQRYSDWHTTGHE